MDDELSELCKLAGVGPGGKESTKSSNNLLSGTEKAEIMRSKNIKPGSKEWFRLWFSRPGLTGENPVSA